MLRAPAPDRARSAGMAMLAALVILAAGCIDKDTAQKAIEAVQGGPPKPDVMPRMLNAEPPFRVPTALWDRKVQGNVTLRLYVDSTGAVVHDSTSVDQSSGYPALDSAALRGAAQLRFAPAQLKGKPVGTIVFFPVYFRHPGAPPLPGDTALHADTLTSHD
ncbi:MAG TPA: energy transducer TonB [Gemmatimonadaceae bacterium]|nr:energy transducer TonB [Gemmatimonadaceae bacterium]